MPKRYIVIGLFTVQAALLIIFGTAAYYSHYLNILAVPMVLCVAVACSVCVKLLKPWLVGVIVICLLVPGAFLLVRQLIFTTNPEFYTVVQILKEQPGPLLTADPMYALASDHIITPFYYAADMRALGTLHHALSDPDLRPVINQSATIVIGPYPNGVVTPQFVDYVQNHYRLIYQDAAHCVFVKD